MNRIYIVRHGETAWNKDMRFQGWSDIELSPAGVKQAELVAKKLSNVKFDCAYASNLKRAVQTAEIIVKECGLSVIEKVELREMCFGQWEGLNRQQVEEKWPGQLDEFFKKPANLCAPEGETFTDFQIRICHVVEEILLGHEDSTILIVTHGGVIRAILASILKMDMSAVWQVNQDNTAINIIDCYGEDHKVVNLINDISHLTE